MSARALLAAMLLVVGCADMPGARDGHDAAAIDTFVATNRFEPLPRAEVLLGGGEEGGPALRIAAVVADTTAARAQGLMGVERVPDGVGMLFVLPDDVGAGGRPGFWMLDTLVALDIVFAAGGVVVGTATMLPCPGPPCPITHPGVDYDVALEVARGVLEAAGIVPGDRFTWALVEGAG